MKPLAPAERRALRARAHHLRPVVSVGQHGLTAAVLTEIDVALRAHELVKIRVFSDERAERETFLARICAALDAAPVQHLGKLLIVWRPAPEPAANEPAQAERRDVRRPRTTAGTGREAARARDARARATPRPAARKGKVVTRERASATRVDARAVRRRRKTR